MLHQITLPFATNLPLAVVLIGEIARQKGRPDIAADCDTASKQLPDVQVDYSLQAVEFFCHACDQARARNEPKTVALLEDLIAKLKNAQNRRILGGLNITPGATPADIERQVEGLAKRVIERLGG